MSRAFIFRVNYPKSFLRLLLTGFLLIALLLGAALVKTVFSLEALAKQSEEATDQAVQLTRSLQVLSESAVTMERTARQFLVLEDKSFLQGYTAAEKSAVQALEELQSLRSSKEMSRDVRQWQQQRGAISHLLLRNPPLPDLERAKLLEHFGNLAQLNQRLLDESYRLIDLRLLEVRHSLSQQKRELAVMVVGFFVFVALLTFGFGVLISRPIRQLDHAIRRLGDNELEQAVHIDGPADLSYLGQRLDWLRQRLQALEEEKSRFLHHMSHELKTPLAAIREGAELLGDEVVGPLSHGQRQVARILRQNSLVMQKQIEDLLNYNAAHFATSQLQLEDCALDQLLEDVLQVYPLQLRTQQLRVLKQVDPVTVRCDREKMRTVFDNLISNAIKFSPSAGTIFLKLQTVGDQVQFDCIDQGVGVDATEKDRLFDPFFQGSQQPHSHVQGSGIGLSIAREYVELHQGTISIVDRPTPHMAENANTVASQSGGAHFRVSLPNKMAE